MNKIIIIIIGVVLIGGIVFAFKNLYSPLVVAPELTSTVNTEKTTPSQTQVSSTSTTSMVKPVDISINILDRIEIAIRAKLQK